MSIYTITVAVFLSGVATAAAAGDFSPSVEVNLGVLTHLDPAPAMQQAPISETYAASSFVASPVMQAPAESPQPVMQAAMVQPQAMELQAAPETAPQAESSMLADGWNALWSRRAGGAIPSAVNNGYVEAGVSQNGLSENLGDWRGGYLLGEWQVTQRHRLNGEIQYMDRFRDEGVYFALGDTYIFNEDWYGSFNAGTSTGGFFLPKYRVDAFLYRKWLENDQLVTSVGVGQYEARDVYRDRSLSLGAAYYFQGPWIVEGGVRYNVSSPGSVDSFSQFVAVTYGMSNDYLVTLRYGFGDESYQVIAPGNPISDFSSDDVSLTWRQWLTDDWGYNLRGEYYKNPSYKRLGLNVGIFKEF